LIAEIAVATNTVPSSWLGESDEMLATVIDIFAERVERTEAARTKRRR
jgi:predicted ATP-grasp superfamily ATP-dependent carboligase